MHPPGHRGKVVADGEHHEGKEEVDCNALKAINILEGKVEERVRVTMVQESKGRNGHKVPEDMPQS
jgi:predicted metal-binding protein